MRHSFKGLCSHKPDLMRDCRNRANIAAAHIEHDYKGGTQILNVTHNANRNRAHSGYKESHMSNKVHATFVIGMLAAGTCAFGGDRITGVSTTTIAAHSDARIAVPFTQQSRGSFTATGTTAGGVTVAGPLQTNVFQAAYFVRFTSGAAAGRWSTVTGNTATELMLESPSVLTGVVAGDQFDLYPHQTLATAFPDELEGLSFRKSASAFIRSTEILVPATGVGVNKSAGATYFYLNGEWRRFGTAGNFDQTILPPQRHFIVRNNSSTPLSVHTFGEVVTTSQVTSLPIEGQQNDTPAATGQPLPLTLSQLHLGGTPAFTSSADADNRADELLVFDGAAPGQNKLPSAVYFYIDGQGWRKVGEAGNFNQQRLPTGAAIVVRKAPGAVGSVNWTQTSPF